MFIHDFVKGEYDEIDETHFIFSKEKESVNAFIGVGEGEIKAFFFLVLVKEFICD
jgi:hypothetical protein